jgi:Flp pilus assembly protein CpaB
MRLNRTAQVGLIVIVAAFLLAAILFLFKPRNDVSVATANNAANPNLVPTGGQAPVPVSGRTFKARMNIPERTILTRDMFVESDDIEDPDDKVYVTDFRNQALGYLTARPILLGRPLKTEDLLGSISDLGVSAAVRDGYRAITIAVPNKPTLHNIVSIGDYVDVLATFEQAESRVIADQVRVLGVDVYGRDYERAPLAKRGSFNPGPPQAAGAAPAPNATPTPTPTPPPNGAPPARPEAALILEVLPDQAAAIALAQASNAPLDYLIQPRPQLDWKPTPNLARVIKPQVAPYAVASKRPSASAPSGTTRTVSTGGGGTVRPIPTMPKPVWTGPMSTDNLTPVATPKPKTYDIVVYPDGLPPRVNTVPIPE